MGRSTTSVPPQKRDADTKVAQSRLSVLELAKELGNVAEACRQPHTPDIRPNFRIDLRRGGIRKRRVGFHPTSSPTPDARPTSPIDVRRPYSPKPPSGTVPDHSGSTRPRDMSRWMDECGHSTARATNPCFTGLIQQYRTCAAKSASPRMWCSQ